MEPPVNLEIPALSGIKPGLGDSRVRSGSRANRVFDIVVAGAIALLLLPVFLVVAIWVRIDSPGPVLFRQKRLGLNGELFEMLKFRKFPHDWGTGGAQLTMQNDVRMTSAGRLLERTKLDELPQLWNILKGDMSIIGPRPESPRYATLFNGPYAALLAARPGLFSPAQIKMGAEHQYYPVDADPEVFYEETIFPFKAHMTLEYEQSRTLLSDIYWVFTGLGTTALRSVDWTHWLKRMVPLMVADAFAVVLGWIGAHMLRFGLDITAYSGFAAKSFLPGLAILPVAVVFTLILTRSYRASIRYFGFSDCIRLLVRAAAGWGVGFLVFIGLFNRETSILLAPSGLVFSASIMLLLRYTYRERKRAELRHVNVSCTPTENKRQVLIYGASDRGLALAAMVNYSENPKTILGFIDDTPQKRSMHVGGLSIVGCSRDMLDIEKRLAPDEIWCAQKPSEFANRQFTKWAEAKSDRRVVRIPS